MKVTALVVAKCEATTESEAVILANATDLSNLGYFLKKSAAEGIVFTSRTLADRTPPSHRLRVQIEEYMVYAYNRNGLCALGFMDSDYPVRSSFALLNQVLDKYEEAFGDSWRTAQEDSTQPWPYLNEALTKFQDPAEADRLVKIQKSWMTRKSSFLLARGEKLDSLVEKSSDLSAQSKVFLKMAKNTNQCCSIL